MNKFVEHVGNNLIILAPNFFLYLTPAEQQAYIGLELASLEAGMEFDIGGSHETFIAPKRSIFRTVSGLLTLTGLAVLYGKPFVEKSIEYLPTLKNIFISKGTALIAGCVAINGISTALENRHHLQQLNKAQFEVIDRLGAQRLLSIREKQVHWGHRNASWLMNKLYYLLGKLSLVYCPESNLELINEYLAHKKDEQNK